MVGYVPLGPPDPPEWEVMISDDLLYEVLGVLNRVGYDMSGGLHYMIKNPREYTGSYLEWTERGWGTRFIITKDRHGGTDFHERVTGVYVYNLDKNAAWNAFSEVDIASANTELVALFATHGVM